MKKLNSQPFLNEKYRQPVRKCPKCGELIERVFLNDNQSFVTECRCPERIRDLKEIDRISNNKDIIINRNKAQCGFSKRDIEDLNQSVKQHKGNIEAYELIIKYANGFDQNVSKGIYLYGDPGVGKSLLSKKVMIVVLNKGFSAYITSITKLMKDIKKELQTFNDDTYRKCLSVDLLVIDDIGTEKPTDFDKAQIFEIINERYENKKPIIYTSNCSLEEITTKYDDFGRIYSRISGSVIKMEVKGKDFRISK